MSDKKIPVIPTRFPYPPPSVQYPPRYTGPIAPRYHYIPPTYDQYSNQYPLEQYLTTCTSDQAFNKQYQYDETTATYECGTSFTDPNYSYTGYIQGTSIECTGNYYSASATYYSQTEETHSGPISSSVGRERYDKNSNEPRKLNTMNDIDKTTRNSEKVYLNSHMSYKLKSDKGYIRSRSNSQGHSQQTQRLKSQDPSKKTYLPKTPTSKPFSKTERDIILEKWRKNYCATSEEVSNKLEELSKLTQDEILEREKSFWTRTTPADLYYDRDEDNHKIIKGTLKLKKICDQFKEELVLRAKKVNDLKPTYETPQRKKRSRFCKHKSEPCHSDSSSNDDFSEEEEENIMEELTRKQQHPDRLHQEMWYNDPGEMNDGPLCRCSLKSRKSGIRHGIYAGEKFLKLCDKDTNNATNLYHYKITISPPTNFLTKTPTIIKHDEHEFIFEGFSMFSHFPLVKLPTCKVIRFNIEYTILYIEEKHPDNFTIRELDLFQDFLFKELLELVDLDFHAAGDVDGCSQFHFMPRFVRDLPDNGREILSMKEVLQYLLNSSQLLIDSSQLENMIQMSQYEWQAFADDVKGMVVTYPGKKPCSVRVDQLDRNTDLQVKGKLNFPEIIHFGIRPPQLSYAGNPEYQKAWRDYVKFRHLLANMSKPTFEDKRKLEAKEGKLQEMRTQSKMKRDVTVAVSAEGFYKTGIMCDIVQHAMLIPVLVCHLRFHHSLNILEKNICYKFQNRALLQLALTHPSYRENFGTNPDHARNSLTNCGIRQPEYGDRRIHYMNTRKRGINTLINIMSRFGKKHETESNITHNERLEFLGDAVVEFLSSIHLFLMFPDLEEGGLATYRAAIVQNQHLAVLARILDLDQFMLYAHGSDLCHDLELRHAMANCFEALMGALFLDGGIEVADQVFGSTLFKNESELLEIWENLPLHPLQEQEPTGDRQWIPKFEVLQKLTKFEESIGVMFNHIRLLARAFTDRSIGYTNLTLGSNQRLEFLGDTVLQLIASEYLYKYFPEHHEGHLSLLRSSLVNNRTQAVVCDDLGMANYAVYNNPKAELKTKDRADLLEAFIGALYIDHDLEYCRVFCQVTLFPRLQDFIMNQDWNDPKSKLQQCCLTLRTMDGGEPDIPVYKVIECKGPTNTRVYTVAVYFRNKRLAKATGHSIQQAEMNSAKNALEISQDLFPQLDHQKRVIAKSMKRQKYPSCQGDESSSSESDNANSVSSLRRSRSKSQTVPSKSNSSQRILSKHESYSRKRPRLNSRDNSRPNDNSRSRENVNLRQNTSKTFDRSFSRYKSPEKSSREKSYSKHIPKTINSKSYSRPRFRDKCKSPARSRSRDYSKTYTRSISKNNSRSRSRSVDSFRNRSRSREYAFKTFKNLEYTSPRMQNKSQTSYRLCSKEMSKRTFLKNESQLHEINCITLDCKSPRSDSKSRSESNHASGSSISSNLRPNLRDEIIKNNSSSQEQPLSKMILLKRDNKCKDSTLDNYSKYLQELKNKMNTSLNDVSKSNFQKRIPEINKNESTTSIIKFVTGKSKSDDLPQIH